MPTNLLSANTRQVQMLMKQRTKKLKTRIYSLDHNDNVIGEIRGVLTGGSVDISNSDLQRRSVSMDLVCNSKIEVGMNSPFWINKRFQPYIGVENFAGETFWFNLGIFIPTEIGTEVSVTGRTMTVSGLDKMMLSDNPVLAGTMLIHENTKVADAIKALGEAYGETKFLMNNYDYELPYKYELEAGDSLQDGLKDICNLYMNYEVYYDTNGYLVFDKQKNRLYDSPVWEFVKPNDFTINRSLSIDYTSIYNDFHVYGHYDDKTAEQPKYILTITDENHPFSVDNMKRKHSMYVSEDKYTKVAQCMERALYEKEKSENLMNTFSISTAPIYSLNDVNKVIKVADNDKLYTCLIDSISYPLDVGTPMEIGCHEIFQ